jgi:ABC-type dipeptide/oligopeptide/nickel transport system ATPase component
MTPRELRNIRGNEIAYIFQEPSTSLNPVFTIRNQVAEAIRLHRPEVRDLDSRHGVKSRFAEELDGPPNNARVASFATYFDCVPGFERLLAEHDHDLPRFYAAARALAKLPREERRSRLCGGSAP